jgi:hypothetical protein
MRQIASIAVAIAALTVTALPGRADDQSIDFALGTIGGTALPVRGDVPQAPITPRPYSALERGAPALQGTEAYAGYAQSGGYVQRNCSYSGGPKSGTSWTCQ